VFASGDNSRATCVTFGDAFDPKRNAFAFLRIVLALLVIVSHSYALGGFGPDPLAAITDGSHNLGEIAVAIFFLLSGFLLTRSGLRSASIGRFLWHRFLRIFPGYWICLLLTAFVFSPLFELLKHGAFSADASLAYVRGNWTMFHLNGFSIEGVMNLCPATIGSVLNENPHPWNLNGSLWSLPYECACYLVLALFALAGVLRRARFAIVILYGGLWALYAFSYLDTEYFHECFPSRYLKPLLFLGLYFSAGCVCYLYRNSIPASKRLFVACLGLLMVGLLFDSFELVAPIAITYASMCLAFWLPIRHFDRYGDFSYGTYIYAFPVQQGLVLLHLDQKGLAVFLAASVIVTLLFAVLSYHGIEGPSLRWRHLNLRGRNPLPAIPNATLAKCTLALVPERVRFGSRVPKR
jgi:peptidoglycan/LPS O-acetylase OafA/YrhL